MAVETWNINLHYEDRNQGRRLLQNSMDRDLISYFELIGLIETAGFSAIDFLYYKKKNPHGTGYLVHIDNDIHVRTMISEHETEKSVELYVFKEQVNIDAAPSDPSTKDDGPAVGLEDAGIHEGGAVRTRKRRTQETLRRSKRLNVVQSHAQYGSGGQDNNQLSLPQGESMHDTQALDDQVEHQDDHVNMTGDSKNVDKRGRTALPAIWNIPNGARIVVSCNTLGQPIGEEGGVLGKFLGTIARLGGYCPLDKKDWRDVKKDGGAETILQCVQTMFMYPAKCDKWILKTTGRDWWRFISSMKRKNGKLCISSDQWRNLVKFWKSKEGRAISEKNKISRAMVKTTHTAGTKSFARWAEDLRQEDPEKKQPHRAKVYIATHRKKAEDKNEHVIELEKLIDEKPELAQNDRGKVAWEGDALYQVLGKEKPGQIHGMGLLPIPKQVYGRTPRYLKNINMTTRDGSSFEGDNDFREKIAKLKQRVEEQAQIIQALKNKDDGQGNNEITMENIRTTHSGNSRPQVIHAKRKRVHCNGTDPVPSLIQQRDTIANKETLLQQHDMREHNDVVLSGEKHDEYAGNDQIRYQEGSSSPPHTASNFLREMKKIKDKMDGNLRGLQQDTQNKSPGHMPSNQRRRTRSSLEIGTTLILKCSMNTRRVAYATFLGCRPKILVGGVELGSLFMHVKVEKPTGEDEDLIRERENCKTIRDAFSMGVTIAWPSACIEKINGGVALGSSDP